MEIFWKGFAGGALIIAVLLISKLLGPKTGGVLAMVPLSFALSFIFVTMGDKDPAHIQSFLIGGGLGLLLFFIFGILLYLLPIVSSHYWTNIVIAYGVWFLGAGVCYFFLQK